jgi:DNA-binding transcriptional LysR family regulator
MANVNLKHLDLNLLVVFEAVYSAGNISHAAGQLAMSQPAVSNALARLRDLLDDPLFVRAKGGVEPTTRAKALIEPIRQALGLIGLHLGSPDTIDLASYRRTFRISTMDILEPLLVPPLLNTIAKRAPGITIEGVASHPDIAQDVLAGTLDLACFAYPAKSPEISIVPIGPVDLVVIARRDHPLIGKRLDVPTMHGLLHVALTAELRSHAQVDRELLVHGIKRHVMMAVSRLWSVPSIVAETDLVGMVPRAFAEYVAANFDIAIHDLPVAISGQHLYLMWNKKMDGDGAHKWVRDHLLQVARQKLGAHDATGLDGSVSVARAPGRRPAGE